MWAARTAANGKSARTGLALAAGDTSQIHLSPQTRRPGARHLARLASSFRVDFYQQAIYTLAVHGYPGRLHRRKNRSDETSISAITATGACHRQPARRGEQRP